VRKRLEMSAAQLAQRCAQIGAPELTESTIANIETGRKHKSTGRRRRHVTVDELLAFAAALDVAPIHLLTSPDASEDDAYQVTPSVSVSTDKARGWIRGFWTLPGTRNERLFYLLEIPSDERGRVWLPPGEGVSSRISGMEAAIAQLTDALEDLKTHQGDGDAGQ